MKLLTILFTLLAIGSSLFADVPSTLNYQGRVLQNGQPFDGTGYFVFGIYEDTSLLWTNKFPVSSPINNPAAAIDSSDAKASTVRNGVFTIRLGEGESNNAPVGTGVFFDFSNSQPERRKAREKVSLKVWFSPAANGPYTKLEPDITFASVPFAQVAGVAETIKERAVTTTMLADSAVTSAKLLDGSITVTDLVDSVKQGLNPVGTVQIYAGAVTDTGVLSEPVPGYLLCNGAVIDSSASGGKFASLVASLQTAWGNGNNDSNPTTVNLPDLRGVFLRGWSGAAGDSYVDPDRAGRLARKPGGNAGNLVGAFQADEFKSHSHNLPYAMWNFEAPLSHFINSGGNIRGQFGVNRTGNEGGTETRPKNANVNYIIKY